MQLNIAQCLTQNESILMLAVPVTAAAIVIYFWNQEKGSPFLRDL